ncbi:gudP [Symbiodinium pilosum]|uniref:GudP protein n=1 Tax=Symbiodinium pilosum TaxID=2952 RepID=A0A812M528_SYMPI|nr:gudP [Symbiodinium pilosum]
MQLEKEFGFAPDVLGRLLMARGLANSLSGVLWGSLADHMDRKKLLVSSVMLAGIFTLCLAVSKLEWLTPQLASLRGSELKASEIPDAMMPWRFSGLTSALIAGVLPWRDAYRFMGAGTVLLALCLLAMFPAERRQCSERTLAGAVATEMEQLQVIFRIPTFQALLLGGVVGCIPWSALSFMMMFLQDLGFDSSHAALLLAVMSVGRILGCLVGGLLGDTVAGLSPLHGRAFVAQTSIIMGMAPLYWALRCYPHSVRAPSSLAAALFSFSVLASWCNPGVDRPLWSELVSPTRRGKTIAWWTAIAQSFGSIFAGPVVGYICVSVLGYQPGAENHRQGNAESLGTAMAVCTMIPWIICFCCYSAIHATYPSDRHAEGLVGPGGK